MSDVHIVVGGQFGSEGKGHFVAQLARRLGNPAVIRTGGPNAGHTAYDKDGRQWKLRQIPAAAVTSHGPLGIAAGSEIDLHVLADEIRQLDEAGHKVSERLHVDSQATIVTDEHAAVDFSQLNARIGSTGKGIGAARADRIMRVASLYGGEGDALDMARRHLKHGHQVIIEASQGWGLGLHAGYYPYCTSRDVRAIDAMAEVGLSPSECRTITWVVFRPHPIRVAGNSGPLKSETSWSDLGIEPEYTTVTGKIRRVGAWDTDLARRAMKANGGPSAWVRPVLMFADYVDPSLYKVKKMPNGMLWPAFKGYEEDLETDIHAFGTGPHTLIWRYTY
jgi:adenylosuccinate synthase